MIKPFGPVPLFSSQSWRSSSNSRQDSLDRPTESIPLQKFKPKHVKQDKPQSEYFSFPRVDSWSDYDDDASSISSKASQENTPAMKSLKTAQKALIKNPPLPKQVIGWNLPPILQVPFRWLLNIKSHLWRSTPLSANQ